MAIYDHVERCPAPDGILWGPILECAKRLLHERANGRMPAHDRAPAARAIAVRADVHAIAALTAAGDVGYMSGGSATRSHVLAVATHGLKAERRHVVDNHVIVDCTFP